MSIGKVLWATFIDWCSTTSIAGIGKAVQSKSYFKKTYWTVLFLAGAIITLYQTIDVLDYYFDFDVTTTNDLTFETSLPFPAISICNQNRSVKNKIHLQF